jgi:hypothetical protein
MEYRLSILFPDGSKSRAYYLTIEDAVNALRSVTVTRERCGLAPVSLTIDPIQL